MPITDLQQIFFHEAVESFSNMLAPIAACSYAVADNGCGKGDIVRVPYCTSNSASAEFTYLTGYTAESVQVTGKDITLNHIKYQKLDISDSDMCRLSTNSLMVIAKQAGEALANDVLQQIWADTITDANFPTSASISSSQLTVSSNIVALDKQCNDAKWPSQRSLILGTESKQHLLNNTGISNAYAFGNANPVQAAAIPSIYGFTPYVTNTTLPNSCKGLVVSPAGVLVAFGFHQPKSVESKGLITLQEGFASNGIRIGLRQWYDGNFAVQRMVIECLFGAAKGESGAVFQMK
jgi:hypothetical protein